VFLGSAGHLLGQSDAIRVVLGTTEEIVELPGVSYRMPAWVGDSSYLVNTRVGLSGHVVGTMYVQGGGVTNAVNDLVVFYAERRPPARPIPDHRLPRLRLGERRHAPRRAQHSMRRLPPAGRGTFQA